LYIQRVNWERLSPAADVTVPAKKTSPISRKTHKSPGGGNKELPSDKAKKKIRVWKGLVLTQLVKRGRNNQHKTPSAEKAGREDYFPARVCW